jgi:phage FluMu protein Com
MIQFSCTKCGHTYRASDNYAGKRVRCKQCSTVNQIPSAETAGKTGCGDSVAAFNQLLQELSKFEKTAPEMDPNATASPL